MPNSRKTLINGQANRLTGTQTDEWTEGRQQKGMFSVDLSSKGQIKRYNFLLKKNVKIVSLETYIIKNIDSTLNKCWTARYCLGEIIQRKWPFDVRFNTNNKL